MNVGQKETTMRANEEQIEIFGIIMEDFRTIANDAEQLYENGTDKMDRAIGKDTMMTIATIVSNLKQIASGFDNFDEITAEVNSWNRRN
jgi:hypothetical protein